MAFGNAKTLPAKPAKKAAKAGIALPGLEDVASLDALIKSLTALHKTMTQDLKEGAIADHFITTGCASKLRPDNYKAVDGDASASIELRSRSTTSVLSDDEQALLAGHKLPTQTIVDVVQTYVINPAYLNDEKLLEAVEKKISKIPGIPEDFIMQQEGKQRVVVTDETLPALFRLPAPIAASLLSVVGVLAIKPKLETGDLMAAFENIRHLIDPTVTRTVKAA